MSDKKRINSKILGEMEKSLNQKTEIKVCNEEYTVSVVLSIRDTKIDSIIADFAFLLDEISKLKEYDGDVVLTTLSLQPACIMYHLTDLYFPNPQKDLHKFVNAYKVYLDMGIVKEVTDQMTSEDIQKLKDRMEQFAEQYKQMSMILAQDVLKNGEKHEEHETTV